MEPINKRFEKLENSQRISYLIGGFITNILTIEEREELDAWVVADQGNMQLFEDMTDDQMVDKFLKWLDFTSIHYQPMAAWPAVIPEWVNRKHPNGPVRVWDTESWVANTEDRVAGVIASMRARGYFF